MEAVMSEQQEQNQSVQPLVSAEYLNDTAKIKEYVRTVRANPSYRANEGQVRWDRVWRDHPHWRVLLCGAGDLHKQRLYQINHEVSIEESGHTISEHRKLRGTGKVKAKYRLAKPRVNKSAKPNERKHTSEYKERRRAARARELGRNYQADCPECQRIFYGSNEENIRRGMGRHLVVDHGRPLGSVRGIELKITRNTGAGPTTDTLTGLLAQIAPPYNPVPEGHEQRIRLVLAIREAIEWLDVGSPGRAREALLAATQKQ